MFFNTPVCHSFSLFLKLFLKQYYNNDGFTIYQTRPEKDTAAAVQLLLDPVLLYCIIFYSIACPFLAECCSFFVCYSLHIPGQAGCLSRPLY